MVMRRPRGPESCRDRGWMTRMGGGLVPVLRRNTIRLFHEKQTKHVATKDRHKAPISTPPFPLSLQDASSRSEYAIKEILYLVEHHTTSRGNVANLASFSGRERNRRL